MAVTARIRWATALTPNTPENFTLELYADAAGQAAFSWSLGIAQLTSSGYVTIQTFTGNCPALGPGQRHNVSLQYTFPAAGNYYATTTASYGATIGRQAFKVSAPYVLIQKHVTNDFTWTTNEPLGVELKNFGDAPGNIVTGNITVKDGGTFQPDGSIAYARTRILPTPYPSAFPMAGGQTKNLAATIGPLLNGYVEIEWPITCAEDTISDHRPVYHLGKVG